MKRRNEYDDEQEMALVQAPILLTMQQAADLAQVGLDRLREWTFEPGFPVIRTPQMVRIHAQAYDDWLRERAIATNSGPRREAAA